MHRFDVDSPVSLVVTQPVGRVDVTAGAGAAVEVVPARAGRSGDERLAAATAVSFDAQVLTVTVPRRRRVLRMSDAVDLRITVPQGSDVTVDARTGSVNLLGPLGQVRATIGHGDFSAADAAEITVELTRGSAELGTVRDSANVTVSSGGITARSLAGDADLHAVRGAIDVDASTGRLSAQASNAVTIGRLGGEASVSSGYGRVSIAAAESGVIEVVTAHSAIDVGVPPGVVAQVDAGTTFGSIRDELEPHGSASPDVVLRLRNASTDIRVHRTR